MFSLLTNKTRQSAEDINWSIDFNLLQPPGHSIAYVVSAFILLVYGLCGQLIALLLDRKDPSKLITRKGAILLSNERLEILSQFRKLRDLPEEDAYHECILAAQMDHPFRPPFFYILTRVHFGFSPFMSRSFYESRFIRFSKYFIMVCAYQIYLCHYYKNSAR